MHRLSINLAVIVLLVTSGVAVRVALRDIPNFAPVAALALFAGFYFVPRTLAASVPIAVMVISDRLVDAGGYSWPLMLTVYGLLTLPVFFRGFLHRYFSLHQASRPRLAASICGLFGCSLACSLMFFLGTNWMVWMTGNWYEPTLTGLMTCLANGIPFFRYTLAGDAVFSMILFGGYATVWATIRSAERALVPVS